MVIFGASGDLTHRKLIPALFNLHLQGLLPDDYSIIGFARRDNTDEGFRVQLRDSMEKYASLDAIDPVVWTDFSSKIFYHQANFDDIQGYYSLRQKLEDVADRGMLRPDGPSRQCLLALKQNLLFYLATPPNYFAGIVDRLEQSGLNYCHSNKQEGWSRIIIEKPFGHDLDSARKLNAHITSVFNEDQIFRIDHYLGKETVQNLLVLRFANAIFEPIWNHNYIDHVQITVSETVGVEGRGPYYDTSGAMRDIMQNHMMHLLALVAMEPPFSLEANTVRDEKVQVLRALRRIPEDCARKCVVRGQYTDGVVKDQPVPGYLQEERVPEGSTTETFIAIKAMIDNWRWAGVPFYLRTGKRMPSRITEIDIHFKPVPQVLFNADNALKHNILSIRIQPNDGMTMRFQVKVPGQAMNIVPAKLDFSYVDTFDQKTPDAYERLILDTIFGDATLFTRSDEVEASWDFFMPIIRGCHSEISEKIPTYPAGSWGPTEADDLLIKDDRFWYLTYRSLKR